VGNIHRLLWERNRILVPHKTEHNGDSLLTVGLFRRKKNVQNLETLTQMLMKFDTATNIRRFHYNFSGSKPEDGFIKKTETCHCYDFLKLFCNCIYIIKTVLGSKNSVSERL